MPAIGARRLRTIILCILCIHVSKSFCARGRDQTPEPEGRHFVSLVDFFFPFLLSSWPFVVLRVPSWITLFFVVVSGTPRPRPHDGRIIRERNRGPGWRIGSTERFRLPSASRFVCLGRPSCAFVDNSFYSVACSAKPGCFRQSPVSARRKNPARTDSRPA